MMAHLGITIKTTVKVDVVLARLKSNLERHSTILREAKAGYLAKAEAELTAALAKVKTGRVAPVGVHLFPPKDYSEHYRTAIDMLSHTQATEITLEADEFRKLMMDQWEWSGDFFTTNRAYSKTAADTLVGWNPAAEADDVGGAFDAADHQPR